MSKVLANEDNLTEKETNYNLDNELVKGLYSRLTEEQWTRSTLENYTKSNFFELDDLIGQAEKEGVIEDIRELCIDHLERFPKSIIALYIVGVITYEKEIIDDSYIFQIISLFKEDRRWPVIEFLAEKILSYGENRFALKIIEEVYDKTENTSELILIWKRIAKVDYESGEVPYKLASHFEDEGNLEESLFYYKMALKRFAKGQKSSMKLIEDIWFKLIDRISTDLHFFMQIEEEIAEVDREKATELLSALLIPYREKNDYDNAVLILKRMLDCKPKDREIRTELINVLREKYLSHSQLDNYLEKSGLVKFNRSVKEALEMFQRYIIFDIGRYVYHRSWGIGKIVDCKQDFLLIDFEGNKKNHKMSLKIVLTSLKSINEDHIWIRKQNDAEVELFKKEDTEGIKNTLIVIFKSYHNTATMKEIKKEMLGIIPAKSWTKWWNKAKQVMKTSSLFGNSPTKRDLYFLRDKPLSFEEETYSNFQSNTSFEGRLSIMLDYLKHSNDINYEGFQYMLNCFVEIANNKVSIDEKNIKSFLLLRKIKKDNPNVTFELKLNPYELLSEKEGLINAYSTLGDSAFRKDIIDIIRKNDSEWYNIFLRILKEVRATKTCNIIVEKLIKYDKIDVLKEAVSYIIDRYRNNIESYFWIAKILISNKSLAKRLSVDNNRLIFNLFHSLDIMSKNVISKKAGVQKSTKKVFAQILDFLIKEEVFISSLKDITEADGRKIVALVNSIGLLDEKSKAYFLTGIFDLFPSLLKDEVKTTRVIHDFLVTGDSFERKQKELQHIVNVEIPNNSKAIGIAKEYGDLRENAEYTAALEHQKHLQEIYSKLTDDLSKVKVLEKETVDKSVVSPGTHIVLSNLDTNEEEDYAILGEWESDMEKGIISYKSPFGQALLGKKKGRSLTFKHSGVSKRYKVKEIEIAKQLS